MSRTKAREIALHLIYEMDFHEFETEESILERLGKEECASIAGENELYAGPLSAKQTAYSVQVVQGVAAHRDELDKQIAGNLKGWSLKRVTRISRAVLRLALYEMDYVHDVPTGAAINEAVELAKAYDSEEAGKFVNGILGSLGRAERSKPAAGSAEAIPAAAPDGAGSASETGETNAGDADA